jgi:uncharacterized protein YlxW (UPF0749 family)
MGLLNYITAHSLDEDYAHAAHARRDAREGATGGAVGDTVGGRVGGTARRGVPTLVVLALFGALVTTAGVQTARSEPVRQSSRESLVAQAQDRRSELGAAREQVADLRAAIDEGQQELLAASAAGRALRDRVVELGVAAGGAAASGPGVRITVDDSGKTIATRQVVLDTDLQKLVNGLWVSGAEAIAINGQRVTNLTAIRIAGDAITVNLRSLDRPYVVSAIGDPGDLAARFVESDGGTWWLNLKAVYNLQFTMTSEDSLTVPAAPAINLRHARPPAEERGKRPVEPPADRSGANR